MYIDEYLGEKKAKNLSTMIYALGLGLGIMSTIDNELFNINEIEIGLKNLPSHYIDDKERENDQ